MECPDDNALAALLDGRLPPGDVARLDEHAAGCGGCRALLAEVVRPVAGGAGAPPSPESAPTLVDGDLLAGASAAHDPRIGATLDQKWHLERVIGQGGMARVYEARHRNGRKVAIKVLRPELAVDPRLLPRFLREGKVANSIPHSGVVSIVDDGATDDGAPYIVMELLLGETLGEKLEREGRLPEKDVLRLADDLLDVLAAAHANGILHRDLKPDNVFLTTAGELKVLDFGIARFRERARRATDSGTSMGTPAFMPPEQARGRWEEVDARSDLFGVGATMNALLTGEPPRRAETGNEELLLAMTAPIAPLAERHAGLAISPGVAAIVDRALAFDPSARWADARTMQAAIRAERSTESVAARSAPPSQAESRPPPRARRWIAIGLAGGAVVVVVAAALGVTGRGATATAGEAASATSSASAPPNAESPATSVPATASAETPRTSDPGAAGKTPASAAPPTSMLAGARRTPPAPAAPPASAAPAPPPITPEATASAPAAAAAPSRDIYDRRH